MNEISKETDAPNGKAAYFSPGRLAHVNLWVDNIDRSEKFYHDTCGLMIEFTEPELMATFMGVGRTQHDLGMMKTTEGKDRYGRDGVLQLPGSIGKTVGLNHIAWEMRNEAELVAAFRRLREDGIKFDTTMDHQIAHSVYMFDPDGNYNEFYCDTIADWRSVLSGEMGLLTSRWNPDAAEGFEDSRIPANPAVRINDAAPVHPKRITHLVLETANMEAMLAFYTKIAGLQVVHASPKAVYLNGYNSEYAFALVLVENKTSAYKYASFELNSEIEFMQSLAGLKERKITIEKVLNLPWKHSLFLRDPDGLLSEWYVPRQQARALDTVPADIFTYAV